MSPGRWRCCGRPRRNWSATSRAPGSCSTRPRPTPPTWSAGVPPAPTNVYGEGRLDALALLRAAPIGDTGRLAGTVVDAQTRQPVGGAAVTIAGPITRHLTTGADGTFSVVLPVGDYTVSVA